MTRNDETRMTQYCYDAPASDGFNALGNAHDLQPDGEAVRNMRWGDRGRSNQLGKEHAGRKVSAPADAGALVTSRSKGPSASAPPKECHGPSPSPYDYRRTQASPPFLRTTITITIAACQSAQASHQFLWHKGGYRVRTTRRSPRVLPPRWRQRCGRSPPGGSPAAAPRRSGRRRTA